MSLQVHGYKMQSDQNVKLVNLNKELEERVLQALDTLREVPGIDQDWLSAGRLQIQQGFMAVNRAVFQPARLK